MTDKPREFWITEKHGYENRLSFANIYTHEPDLLYDKEPKTKVTHVIEYHAFEKLREENELLKNDLKTKCNNCPFIY